MNQDIYNFLIGKEPLGATGSAGSQAKPSRQRYSGLVISGCNLVIDTIENGGPGTLRSCPQACMHFVLGGRTAQDLSRLQNEVSQFLNKARITRLTLRASPDRGKYAGSPMAFKIEAMLHLTPKARIFMVPAITVSTWVKAACPMLPTVVGVSHADAKFHQRALETAAFARAN